MNRYILLLCMFIVFGGCSDTETVKFNNTDVTGVDWDATFNLTDHESKNRTLNDFKGKIVLLFFGFTHCPDVCPTTLARLSEVIRSLNEDGKHVQVLFVTVDPERDDAKIIKDYLSAFHPGFLGLYTDPASTTKMVARFKGYSEKIADKNSDAYMMNHSTFVYAYDQTGRLRLLINPNSTSEQVATDVRLLIKQ